MRTLVAVIGGGMSAEREVSLSTARAVRDHMPRDEFDILPVEILPSGRWRLRNERAVLPEDAVRHLKAARTGVVFIGLHGAGGEDGRLQALLELAGLPYVGSGVSASAIAMDKSRTREVMAAHGFMLAPGIELAGLKPAAAATLVLARIGLPAVVKDPCGGSSIGVSLVENAAALRRSLRPLLSAPGGRVLVEKYLLGRELSVPVIGNASLGGRLEALPAILIRPHGRAIFDYRSKYDPLLADELCPAPVAPAIVQRVSEAAIRAHLVLRCDGLSRSDFIVPRGGAPRFLEINTLPGMTANSLCPKSAAAAGLPFPELLRRLVRLAIEKWGRGGR